MLIKFIEQVSAAGYELARRQKGHGSWQQVTNCAKNVT